MTRRMAEMENGCFRRSQSIGFYAPFYLEFVTLDGPIMVEELLNIL